MGQLSYLDERGYVRESFKRPVEVDAGRMRYLGQITPESERTENPFNRDVLQGRGHDYMSAGVDYNMPTRVCRDCGHEKILDEYRFRLDGRHFRRECRECESRRASSRAWNRRNNVHHGYGNRQMNPNYE